MPNTLINTQMITQEILRLLNNELAFAGSIPRQYDDRFAKKGAKVGDTVSVRKPVRSQVQDGEVFVGNDIEEKSVPIVVDKRKHVGFSYGNMDLTLKMDDFSNRYLRDPVVKLANQIDFDGLQEYKNVPAFIGTPGTAVTTVNNFLNGGAQMDDEAVPRAMRKMLISSGMHAALAIGEKALFHPGTTVSDALRKGLFSRNFLGFQEWLMDQNVARHTTGLMGTSGAPTSVPLVDTPLPAEGASIVHTDGWDASITGVLKRGDTIDFGGVNAVNPINYQSTGALRQFVVTADVNSDGTGDADIPVYPALTTTGPYKNVTALPANNAVVRIWGTATMTAVDGIQSPQGMAYHPEAFALVMVDLERPTDGVTSERISDPELGLSMLLTKQFNILTFKTVCRLDVLYGWKTVYPELAMRFVA